MVENKSVWGPSVLLRWFRDLRRNQRIRKALGADKVVRVPRGMSDAEFFIKRKRAIEAESHKHPVEFIKGF